MNDLKILKELTVLYVDDDTQACESLEHILKYYFKSVFIAYNGVEALNIYSENECHLLIVDYDMPLMNGYEFLSKVREVDDTISAFIMSSYDDKVKLKNALKLNLLDYLVKPYELIDLKSILHQFVKIVERKGLLRFFITDNCYYHKKTKSLYVDEKEISLTLYEIKIFEYFLANREKTIPYDELLDILETTNQKSLVSLIYKISKKLPVKCIKNIKDVGYIFK